VESYKGTRKNSGGATNIGNSEVPEGSQAIKKRKKTGSDTQNVTGFCEFEKKRKGLKACEHKKGKKAGEARSVGLGGTGGVS